MTRCRGDLSLTEASIWRISVAAAAIAPAAGLLRVARHLNVGI